MNTIRKMFWSMLVIPFLLSGNALAGDKTPSGTIVIDETQFSVLIGGDMGGGTLMFDGKSYSFKTEGLKIGGVGAHKVHLVGKVYDLNDVADFPGIYTAAEVGITVTNWGAGVDWLENEKGVKLTIKTSSDQGLSLDGGVEGFKIKMK